MIKFFRRFRQKLLADNKFSKYLIYAAGEIVLVVIGILIALQVNNWNEGRKMRVKNQENLHALSQELQANKLILDKSINKVRHMTRLGLNMMDTLYADVIPEKEKDLYLLETIGSLGPLRLPEFTTAALDEIINSGSFSTILSTEVKERILAYKAQLDEVEATETRHEQNFQNIELPYLTRHLSISDMLTNRSPRIHEADVALLGDGIPDFQRENYYYSHDHEAFFKNREFASMSTNRYFDLRAVLKSSINLVAVTDSLLDSIHKEINSLE